MYDTENVIFSSNENKGLQSITEICYRQYGVNKTGHITLKLFSVHAPRAFVWLLGLYGGNLGLYLPIPLENEFFKISQTYVGRGILKKRQ